MPSRTCPDCVHPPNPPPSLGTLAPPPAYASGHVCTIFESLSTPIEHILAGTPDIKDSPEALKRCKDALSAIQAEGSPIGKNRPCIILGNVSNPDETTGIELILLGTFGRTPYDQLSLLDRLFVVPVSPNPAAKHTIHFHTSPAWDSSHCWAIAFIFKSTRPLKGLWPRARFDMALPDGKTMSTPSPHCVGAQPIYEASHDTRPVIVEKCRFNLERWSSQCIEDPTLAVECEEGFRSRLQAKGSVSRRNSVDTCAPSVRSFRSNHSQRKFSRCSSPLVPVPGKSDVASTKQVEVDMKMKSTPSTPSRSRRSSLKRTGGGAFDPSARKVQSKSSLGKFGLQLT
ncbi:hypothetical protein OH76DRAFT_1404565 [Lentinus brumalis]|uniref:Uncharacterized protein n=1 Tax=Lentinus brumalis TaxID=2498619 RepID=A0A371D7Y7_9APHY|nr:hypothetical protein OH76DRAFT_1404565 [Polyporus brumalis]